ncbi:MAG: 16S rRNA (cytosine(967)-C(5))-methyltransferase RsmB [Gammaproteobacteria bacterium]|nr:16S rRNA (cytosine(967)-C(5))-methyltransferase RsmB [Gammaproteobacteria bacterium]MYF03161.1 16S rRNA (cytosine(967)-C(5))-methyltransferase RsmB [Gammaproteobacteria bacterium]MYI77509.1 16S rRNA (cytosine(967)-C(5))-methyltransferase RsmB [Gammaproteobacteria bacterium]
MASNSTRRHSPNFLAAKVLTKVFQGQPLEDALYEHHESKDIALLTFLCYTTMRHYYSLHQRLSNISHRPLDQMDVEVKCLLLLGACQLQYSTLPAPLAVAHVVTAAKKIGKTSAGGLINAILRRYDTAVEPSMEEARYELPQWMIDRIKTDYPNESDEIFRTSTTRAPMTLRINISEIGSSEYCDLLQEFKIPFKKTALENAITLVKPMSRSKLPGYEEGYFSVQDLASQLPVSLLEPQPEHRILDACAAPGVKSRQIADVFSNNPVDAYDIKQQCSTWNIPTDSGNKQNLVFKQGDLTTTSWWDGTHYDRILLDAPCSGSGTLSRHPDIKVTRNEADVSQAAELQLKLLNNLWGILAPDGVLVYCTCSIFREENDGVVTRFLTEHQDIAIEPFELPIGRPTPGGWQTLPKEQAYDGFFFARMRKQ